MAGPWWGFELQHVKEDCYLIVKRCTSSVGRSEEEVLGREKELWRRIGLAQLGELPGKRTSIVPGREQDVRTICIIRVALRYPILRLVFLSNPAMLDVKYYARTSFRLACLFRTCNHVGEWWHTLVTV